MVIISFGPLNSSSQSVNVRTFIFSIHRHTDFGLLRIRRFDFNQCYRWNAHGDARTLQITVTPSPDAPILTLRELNLIDSTAGSLQWWVYDADGVISIAVAEVQVNGTVIENLSHSCVFDPDDSTNRCLSMLPLPASHNGTVEVRVSVYDEEIGASTVAYISINMSPSQPEPTLPTSESDGLESSVPIFLRH